MSILGLLKGKDEATTLAGIDRCTQPYWRSEQLAAKPVEKCLDLIAADMERPACFITEIVSAQEYERRLVEAKYFDLDEFSNHWGE